MKFIKIIKADNAYEISKFKQVVVDLVKKYNDSGIEPEIDLDGKYYSNGWVTVNFKKGIKYPSFKLSEDEYTKQYNELEEKKEQIRDILFDIRTELRQIYRRKLSDVHTTDDLADVFGLNLR